ncbi:MAG: CDP-alcohol phosphatidyltransferase family protein [Planctomycetes bacterium]|nr:CDP-alcohol phosphatidyltransferase family protein [Planctomycetota bacterium]
MTETALIRGSSPVRHWGLTPPARLRKTLEALGFRVYDDAAGLPADAASVLVLRGDLLYDDRIVKMLATRPGLALVGSDEPSSEVLAWFGTRDQAALDSPTQHQLLGLKPITPTGLLQGQKVRLLKAQRPFVLPATEASRVAHERLLYDSSYKGVTDLVTKWMWPMPARHCVKVCTQLGITPNLVTVTGFLLTLAALYLFWIGAFGWGLLCGWGMTFLDTVDGKLARTTITVSPFGHWLDKLTDIIHPPFWYLAWGVGLGPDGFDAPPPGWSLAVTQSLMFGGYLGGRIVEGFATGIMIKGGLFVWRPFDSWFRLITARRNPCLIILTVALMAGRPDLGIWAVAWWTVVTTVVLVVRLLTALAVRNPGERLSSWLQNVDLDEARPSLSVRVFTQGVRRRT